MSMNVHDRSNGELMSGACVPFAVPLLRKLQAYANLAALPAVVLLSLAGQVRAAPIFSEDFDGFTAPGGDFNGGQLRSNLVVAHTGDVTGWSKAGSGTVHAIDRANTFPRAGKQQDFAVMLFQDNVLTRDTAIAANLSGKLYRVDFEASPAVYQVESQKTTASDALLIEVLRGDNSVLVAHAHSPGAWSGKMKFSSGDFQYTGDGTGNVRLRIGPNGPMPSGRFAGAIDNVTVSAVHEPGSAPFPALVRKPPDFAREVRPIFEKSFHSHPIGSVGASGSPDFALI